MRAALPSEGDFDGRGEAGCEEISGEVGVHGQQLAGLTRSQLDAVLHRGRQRHLGEWVAGIDGRHLNRQQNDLVCLHLFSCIDQLSRNQKQVSTH